MTKILLAKVKKYKYVCQGCISKCKLINDGKAKPCFCSYDGTMIKWKLKKESE
jgi:rRNA maturation endonuclease Nob1